MTFLVLIRTSPITNVRYARSFVLWTIDGWVIDHQLSWLWPVQLSMQRSLLYTARLPVSFISLTTITNNMYEHAGVGVAGVQDNTDRITTLTVGQVSMCVVGGGGRYTVALWQ